MGWNSYDYYDTTVDEDRVKANAEYMAAHLKQYGWEYITICAGDSVSAVVPDHGARLFRFKV